MRYLKLNALTLVLALVVTTTGINAAAQPIPDYKQQTNGKTTLAIGLGFGVGIVAAILVRTITTNNKAAALYGQGEAYASQGVWDLAADAYAACIGVRPSYRDAQQKLFAARSAAEVMLVQRGDAARSLEHFDEATEHYRRALVYVPDSTQAKARLEALSQDLVAVHYRQGMAYEVRNQWTEALAEYEVAYKQDPNYEDVTDRYLRARAHVKGNTPLRAVLFFIDRAGQTGLDLELLRNIQLEMQSASAGRYVLVDLARAQDLVRQQAPALSNQLDDRLAIDIGRMLDVDEVVTGEILSLTATGDRLEMRATIKVLTVSNGSVKSRSEAVHRFAKGTNTTQVPEYLREIATKLVNDLR